MKKLSLFVSVAALLSACVYTIERDAPGDMRSPKYQPSSSSVPQVGGVSSPTPISSSSVIGCPNTFVDNRDNKTYRAVQIGLQCWMAENLNYGIKILGVNLQTNESQVEKYCFNDDDSQCLLFGGLYQWTEVMDLPNVCNSQECGSQVKSIHRGICPAGWHVPSDEEWKVLEVRTGMSQTDADLTGWRGANSYKLRSITGWINGNGSNEFGFKILPAGYRGLQGNFLEQGTDAYFWTSFFGSGNQALNRNFYGARDGISRLNAARASGFSLRCIKD